MIFFQPGDSGINSMLGQMMWFKRFAVGHGLDYTCAVDLDHSPRNFVTRSIHALLLDEELKSNLAIPFDETIGLNAFFRQVVEGRFSLKGRNVRVVAGDISNPSEPGLWRSHDFQLHCIEQGFLSDRYPYWAIDLHEFTKQGEIFGSGRIPVDGRKALRLFAHMRLGDAAALASEAIAEQTGKKTPGHVLTASRLMSADEFDCYRMGLHAAFPPRHYAERGARTVSPDTFALALARLQQHAGPSSRTIFATDGYSRASAWLSPIIDLPVSEIEVALNRLLLPVSTLATSSLIGENGDDLSEVLWGIAEADILLTTSSLFVPIVKCALAGVNALDRWTMIDETDSLSRYLQLPAVVDHSLLVFSERLKRLAKEEPSLRPV